MKELQFLLSLKNNLSAPLGKAKQSLDTFGKYTQRSLRATGIGIAGLLGAGVAFKALTAPAAQLQSALGGLEKQGVGAETLTRLKKSAAQFSTDYGVAAADFVRATGDIHFALGGIADRDLPRAARAVNTLAVATQSSSSDAAGYIAALAGTFATESAYMGKVGFAENIASRTAWLVANTGQDMAKIQELLQGAKGTGSSYGVGMDEQLAVLSSLGSSVGSAAGVTYDAFLRNARSGAKELGLSFTDAQGRLLAFPDILDKLQGKYGDAIVGNIALQEKLNKAFGKGAAALVKSWGSSDKLRKNIKALSGSNGLDTAAGQAAMMAGTWNRLARVGDRVRIAIGEQLLFAIKPTTDGLIRGGAQFAKWLEMFPNITRQISYVSAGLIGLTAVSATGTLIAGISGMVWGTLKTLWAVTTGVLKGLVWVLNLKARALQVAAVWTVLQTAVMGKLRAALLIGSIAMRGFALSTLWSNTAMLAQRLGLMIATGAMAAYGAATAFAGVAMQLLMSPVTLVIAGIALLAAGVWYAISHWDELKASIMDSGAFTFISGVVTALGDVFGKAIGSLKNMFAGLWAWIKAGAIDSLNWIIGKMNKIPGIDIDLVKNEAVPDMADVAPPAGMNAPALERGGVSRSMSRNSSRVDNSRHVGTLNVYPANGETFQSLLESTEMAAP